VGLSSEDVFFCPQKTQIDADCFGFGSSLKDKTPLIENRMSNSNFESNLHFAVVALQMDLINRDQFAAWDKSTWPATKNSDVRLL
jgi:hypothetical protein